MGEIAGVFLAAGLLSVGNIGIAVLTFVLAYIAGFAGTAALGDVRFWSSLIVSLPCGPFAAYPVTALSIRYSVKEGMMDPRQSDRAAA